MDSYIQHPNNTLESLYFLNETQIALLEEEINSGSRAIFRNDCPSNIRITDSYKVKDTKAIVKTLELYKSICPSFFNKRSIRSLKEEWQAHNILYWLGIRRKQTKDVDLNTDESKLRLFGYYLLSKIYWMFELLKK